MTHYDEIKTYLAKIEQHLEQLISTYDWDLETMEKLLHSREVWRQVAESLAGVVSDLAADGRPPQEILDSWVKVAEARIAALDVTL